MNKLCCLIIIFFACRICNGQVLCIFCYDQNDTISAGVNNLLLNGGLETSTCPPHGVFCPNSSQYSCDITNWTCTGGGTSTYANLLDTSSVYGMVAEGIRSAYFGNSQTKCCSTMAGDTSCIGDSLCSVTGIPPVGYPYSTAFYGGTAGVKLEQTVTGLITGSTYILEFWAGGEDGFQDYTESGLFAVDVGFGNIFLRNKPTSAGAVGTRYIIEFNATSPAHTIRFTNWGHICFSCTELVLDDIRLYTLAELSPLVPSCTSGINDFSASSGIANIFPNPVTNELNVKTNSSLLSEIILYDITSRKTIHQSFTTSITISTEQLAKGIYLYEVRNKNGVIKKGKIVKD